MHRNMLFSKHSILCLSLCAATTSVIVEQRDENVMKRDKTLTEIF